MTLCKHRPSLIISGGQTGADQGALYGARDCKINTGGWAPALYNTEDGPAPWLSGFGLTNHRSPLYQPRTAANVDMADATLIVGRRHERGSELTYNLCNKRSKPVLVVPWWAGYQLKIEAVVEFIDEHKPGILNVAGNRESKNKGNADRVRRMVVQLFGVRYHEAEETARLRERFAGS